MGELFLFCVLRFRAPRGFDENFPHTVTVEEAVEEILFGFRELFDVGEGVGEVLYGRQVRCSSTRLDAADLAENVLRNDIRVWKFLVNRLGDSVEVSGILCKNGSIIQASHKQCSETFQNFSMLSLHNLLLMDDDLYSFKNSLESKIP